MAAFGPARFLLLSYRQPRRPPHSRAVTASLVSLSGKGRLWARQIRSLALDSFAYGWRQSRIMSGDQFQTKRSETQSLRSATGTRSISAPTHWEALTGPKFVWHIEQAGWKLLRATDRR